MSEYQNGVNQLPNIIHMIQFSHQTGILAVERNNAGTIEEGRILFLNGQIQAVRSGRYANGEALSQLKSWGECRFQFIKQSEEEITNNLHASLQEEQKTSRATAIQTTNLRFSKGFGGSGIYPIAAPAATYQESLIQYPQTPIAYEPITQPNQKITLPNQGSRDTQEMRAIQDFSRKAEIPDSTPQKSDKDSRIAKMYFEQGKLSRTHRRIFFLIDGIRTCKEIARLAGRSHEEIIQCIQDLQQAGLIRK